MGRNGTNSRNGTRTKTVFTEIGPVDIKVPRDQEGSFAPAIVRKRQRRLNGIDDIVPSLRRLTIGEIAAHFAEVYGAKVSKDAIGRITDKVIQEMAEWRNRSLERVYPVLSIDAIVVKVRDGQAVNRPVYVVIEVTVNGERDILGLWDGSEGFGSQSSPRSKPRRRRRVHCGLRRAQGPTGIDRHHLVVRPGPGLHRALRRAGIMPIGLVKLLMVVA